MVDGKIVQKNKDTGQNRRSIGSLITWLVVAIVGMIFIYQLFSVAFTSS